MLAEHYNCISIMLICRLPTIRTGSGDVLMQVEFEENEFVCSLILYGVKIAHGKKRQNVWNSG